MLEERGKALTQQVALSIRGFLGQEVGEEVLKIARQPYTGHRDSDVPEIFLHFPLAIKVACCQSPGRQPLDVLQAAVDHVVKAQALGQISQQLPLERKGETTKLKREDVCPQSETWLSHPPGAAVPDVKRPTPLHP